jgi:S1-C subfamily serine protease
MERGMDDDRHGIDTGSASAAEGHARPPRRSSGRRRRVATVATAVGLVTVVVAGGAALDRTVVVTGTPSPAATAASALGSPGNGSSGDTHRRGSRSGRVGGDTTNGAGSTGVTRAATGDEALGVVDITTVLDYGTGKAAGTGVVLTSSGEILTNNHVVDGATKITVTDVTTGRSYTASVVGTDPGDDVAVLQLAGASGLGTARFAGAAQVANVAVGDAVTAVGNAGGTGGIPTAAPGTVAALNRDITAGDATASSSEQLSGVIEVAAAVQAGDSGGPLYDSGVVIGIDTAADAGNTVGFAIPITTALDIADRIEAGEQGGAIHLGSPAFLGVGLAGTGDATISGLVSGSAAASAGIDVGDTITAVDGAAVGSAQELSAILKAHQPGDHVAITWTDTTGTSHTATITLAAGPAD